MRLSIPHVSILWSCCVFLSVGIVELAKAQTPEPSTTPWQFAGWYGGGMYPALVPDPAVEGRLYLLSDVAGAWRSDDRGESWRFINDGLRNLYASALAIAPADSNVLYLGTKAGVMRSNDAGVSWQYLPATKFQKPNSYRAIAVSPHDVNTVYAGTKTGEISLSLDGGEHWKQLGKQARPFGEAVPIIALQAGWEGQLFVGSKLGVMRFDWKADAWTPVSVEATHDLRMDRAGRALYATRGRQVAVSLDDGATWQMSADVPRGEVSRLTVVDSASGGGTLVVGWKDGWKGGVFLSEDAGATWSNRGRNLQYDARGNPTRVWMKSFQRPNSVEIDPFNPQILYYTDSWGVWRSDDRGETWQEKIHGAPNASGSDLTISPAGDVYVATMDQGLLKSADGGMSYEAVAPNAKMIEGVSGHVWRIALLGTEPVRFVATSTPWHGPATQVLLGDSQSGLRELVHDGLPDQVLKQRTMWGQGYPRALAGDPSNPERVYLGIDGDDGGGLFISDDGGRHWQRSTGQPDSVRIYNGLAVDPTDPNRLFWGTCDEAGGVHRSVDAGAHWERALKELSCVFDIAVATDGTVYAAGSVAKAGPALYASRDHGTSWKRLHHLEGPGAFEAICVEPGPGKRLFVGLAKWNEAAGGKVLYSPDTGDTWMDVTDGLPESTGPAAMAVHPHDGHLYLLLYAGSVYKRPMDSF